jgi:predicted nucleic-acid-binding protein
MIALDTNVLVRFLVKDDRRQATRARSFLTAAIANNQQLYVSDIVACDLVWVLDSAYGFERTDIVAVLRRLLHAGHLTFGSTDRITQAVDAYATGRGDFADYLVRAEAMDAGCDTVVTFDKTLHREPNFRAL